MNLDWYKNWISQFQC